MFLSSEGIYTCITYHATTPLKTIGTVRNNTSNVHLSVYNCMYYEAHWHVLLYSRSLNSKKPANQLLLQPNLSSICNSRTLLAPSSVCTHSARGKESLNGNGCDVHSHTIVSTTVNAPLVPTTAVMMQPCSRCKCQLSIYHIMEHTL